MPFISLYSASLTQFSGSIIASTGSRNTISGSWVTIATGSYNFLSSGSLSLSTGSFTGSVSAILSYTPINPRDTGSFVFTIQNPSTASLYTIANARSGLLSNTVIQGTFSLDLGIDY
jgi:hypothetical protein